MDTAIKILGSDSPLILGKETLCREPKFRGRLLYLFLGQSGIVWLIRYTHFPNNAPLKR